MRSEAIPSKKSKGRITDCIKRSKSGLLNNLVSAVLGDACFISFGVWLHSSAFSQEHAVYAFSPLGVTDSYMYVFLTPVWMSTVIICYSIKANKGNVISNQIPYLTKQQLLKRLLKMSYMVTCLKLQCCVKSTAKLCKHLKSNFPFYCLCVRSFSGITGLKTKHELLTDC